MSITDIARRHHETIRTVANSAKVLTIDIERLPGTAYAFDPKTRYLPASSWITPPRTICWAARWYGQKRPIFEAEWIDRDRMVERSWELYDSADAVITFNGRRFDNKHLKSLWFEHGLAMPSPWKDIDLFVMAKSTFGFEFKSLDYLTKRLGRPGKELHYNMWLAQAACDGDKGAQKEMRTYNVGDIELTEWLADRMRGWMPQHPFLGTFGDEKRCNQCGSDDLVLQPNRYRAVVLDYALYRCQNCGGNVKGGWVARAANTRGVA